MATNDFSAEEPQNYAQKTVVCFVLDVSGSMRGNPIDELNAGLDQFKNDISKDKTIADRLEVAIVTFSDKIERAVEPGLISTIKLPRLTTSGGTRLVDGAREGLALVTARKAWYKETGQPFLRPWVIVITDGEPDDDQDVNGLGAEVRAGTANKNFLFFAIGVEGANMRRLKDISDPSMQPAKLQGLKFSDFFKWLSASMSVVASSRDGQQVNLPSPAGWMQGVTV